jgi:phage terminase small subunit
LEDEMPKKTKTPETEVAPVARPKRPLPHTLTSRQRSFCEYIVEGIYSNAECARRAGFKSAEVYASKLLNAEMHPQVAAHIAELREQKQRRYGVTLNGQLERLAKLSLGAEDAGQFSAAINAEKVRSALGGLTIDRRETINTLDQMSRDEITARLAALQQKYPSAFSLNSPAMKDITPHASRTRSEILELSQSKSPSRDVAGED